MKTNCKVSIIIPIYNGAKYMREAIDSALAQTYENIEVIVVNDGSTDRTDEIAKTYGDKIRYFAKKNGGVSTALNLGIKKMTGDYFSWLSHDDVYVPGKVERAVSFLSEKKLLNGNVLVYSDYALIDAKSKFLTDVIVNHELTMRKPIYALLRGMINGNSLLVPKKAFDKYGVFDENLRCVQDYELWFRMSRTYDFVHMPGVTILSRYHPKQATNKNPLVKSEGEVLWREMIDSVSQKQQVELSGSEYGFFCQMVRFLRNTPYDGTLRYCEDKMLELVPEEIPKEVYMNYSRPQVFGGNKITKAIRLARREGMKNVVSRGAKKVRKKLKGGGDKTQQKAGKRFGDDVNK